MVTTSGIGRLSSIGLALVWIAYVVVVVLGIAAAGFDDPILGDMALQRIGMLGYGIG